MFLNISKDMSMRDKLKSWLCQKKNSEMFMHDIFDFMAFEKDYIDTIFLESVLGVKGITPIIWPDFVGFG